MALVATLLALGLSGTHAVSYRKIEYNIPMRDGTMLYTSVYVPQNVTGKHPILLERTPYSAGPYGEAARTEFGGSPKFREHGYIFAFQDVRGQYMSDGTYVNVRPAAKPGGTDESTDTYDTIDYLVKHVPENNGAVGMWGISYPGFYAALGGVNSHPALKAISPQAPVTDWFIGDDVHHNGAFFLQDNFEFDTWFDYPRKGPEKEHVGIEIPKNGLSAYDFFLQAGSLDDIDKKLLKGSVPYWTEILGHGTYDAYWQERSTLPRLKNVRCAVLTVGGWFDAEDMWGALNTYSAIERQNPRIENTLVMGPWYHGMWADGKGDQFGDLAFGVPTSEWFRENVEFPFFDRHLRAQAIPAPAEATVFQTGTNQWRTFAQWPPANLGSLTMYLDESRRLAKAAPQSSGSDTYVYDPSRPTPYIENMDATSRPLEYMIDDQRWAEKRPDVATYKGEELKEDVTVAGPIDVDLWVSTTGTDADFVVKVIDVWPSLTRTLSARGRTMANYQQLLRADVMRGKFRNSMERPEPFKPGEPTRVRFRLNDVLHTFKAGHRLMVQVQSAWFPLVDRNPNQFLDIYKAKASDFKSAEITLYHDSAHPSALRFGVLPEK